MTTGPSSGAAYRVLAVQSLILAFCGIALALLWVNFPYPSPLEKPFLPPKLRWPVDQIEAWVEQGQFDEDFAKFFARDPDREIPAGAKFVSPADGTVRFIDYSNNITSLVVSLTFWDVHVVRTPVAGIVTNVDMEGAYFDRLPGPEKVREMMFLRGKAAPVQVIITLATAQGEVRLRMITSYWASRLKVWVSPGTVLAKGDRIGRIVLGSNVVTEFPGRQKLDVTLGQHVLGGETAIAH